MLLNLLSGEELQKSTQLNLISVEKFDFEAVNSINVEH